MRTSQIPVILGGYDSQRQSFVNKVKAAVGATPVASWFPHRNDTTTSVDPISGRVWTADATMAGQISPLGHGSARAFNGTTNYLTTPDAAALNFGNGATDTPFSVFAVANVTDTAAARTFISKFNAGGNQEYWFIVGGGADQLFLEIVDQSAAAPPTRLETAAVTQGSWHTFSVTYSAATGGATAANDMTLYQDGVVVTSTATNQAGYVAMESLSIPVEIGSSDAHTANFMTGSMALMLLFPANVLVAGHLSLTNVCKRYSNI